ncbi:DUF6703 family protein [Motilibacter deserti]|uniref:Uncharacterized protein n=1 Tax=Motilibacter deserti TaxID=2714956 RepID=A0ABX0GS57_9ACTN|nr:DUF6703 family protein [Motilibacter deserti]NHC12600.1 hypothetical protein [Motilibacter deserti]
MTGGPLRRAVSKRSAQPLAAVSRLPRAVLPVVLGVLLVSGLASPPLLGILCLLLVLAFVGWLGYLSWPLATAGGRAGRVALVVLMLGAIGLRVAEL